MLQSVRDHRAPDGEHEAVDLETPPGALWGRSSGGLTQLHPPGAGLMVLSFDQTARFMDPVLPARSASRLMQQHRWPGASQPTVREALARHSSPARVLQRFLFLNTFLMDVAVVGAFSDAAKPAVQARARELGALIRDRFDIAALCEVFEIGVRETILSAWPDGRRPRTESEIRESSVESSGLVTMSQTLGFRRKAFHEFDAQSGDDSYARKGVLLAEVDVGLGASGLEVYSTHLNATGSRTRRAQVDELVAFFHEVHRHRNPALLAGDFNVRSAPGLSTSGGGGTGTEYEHLVQALTRAGLHDLWVTRNGTPGYTSEMQVPGVADRICRPAEDSPWYCDDFSVPSSPPGESGRIDYVFSTAPTRGQTFHVDATRPRRVRMERGAGAPERDRIAFLSDHVGLATTLLLSPA